jgi:hypothetical protein
VNRATVTTGALEMKRTDNPDPGLPDLKFINRIPIVDVARKIGLDFTDDGNTLCPEKSVHPEGTSPYLIVLLSSNKVFCEACGTGLMTVVDMVKKFGGFGTLPDTGECVATFFTVPRIRKASHLNNPKGESVPPDCRDPLALLVKSGLWSQLSVPVQRLIPVLLKLPKWEDGRSECVHRISNRAMMQFTGIGTFTGISEAMTDLAAIGWLERLQLRRRGGSLVYDTAQYRLTPLSAPVRKLADDTAQKFSQKIREEQVLRRQNRQERNFEKMWPSIARDI